MSSTRGEQPELSGRRWRRAATRALYAWLEEFCGQPRRRLDGWMPMGVGRPLDVVVVEPDTVHVWLLPRRSGVLDDYCVRGIADRLSVVVPEGRLAEMRAGVPETFGVATVGTVAGAPVLLEIRRPTQLAVTNVGALGALLTRDELADVVAGLGRRVSPFSVRSALLAEVLEHLSPEEARRRILRALVSG